MLIDQNSLIGYSIDIPTASVAVPAGTWLYRVTQPTYADAGQVFNGRGSKRSGSAGRYHAAYQETTYCSNNILVALSEVLYHDYRTYLRRLQENRTPVNNPIVDRRILAAVEVDAIGDLLLVGTDYVRRLYELSGALAVYPDPEYAPMQGLRNAVERSRNGIVFPSARHSRAQCFALFGDRSAHVRRVEGFEVTLRLLPEDHASRGRTDQFDYSDLVSSIQGSYEFEPSSYARLSTRAWAEPSGIPGSGTIDFIRRDYGSTYPAGAVHR